MSCFAISLVQLYQLIYQWVAKTEKQNYRKNKMAAGFVRKGEKRHLF